MYEIWQHRTIVEDWKNNFWIEAASIIGADTVSKRLMSQEYEENFKI